ncbi:hypothetical protein [Photobacterium swingsii]|uniref:hypothetical protein n=1 Tax=Photobacterium swingsii TaxID=680026 RepID=UPI0040680D52
MKNISLTIEGEYLDSYIYSGNLFLLDENYLLNIYKWDEVVKLALKGVSLFEQLSLTKVLKDSTEKFYAKKDKIKLAITKKDLESTLLSSLHIGLWPSDINVFANILYLSSEKGVSRYDLDYINGTLGKEFIIHDEMSFSISPNSSNRLAIAAGKSGVLTFIPQSRHLNRSDLNQFLESTCTELDWQSTVLLANTVDGVKRADYMRMPIKKEFDDDREFFQTFKDFRAFKPNVRKKESASFSWIGGDKLFSIKDDNSLTVEKLNDNSNSVTIGNLKDNKFIKAKSAAFGAVFETESNLYAMKGESLVKVHGEPVNWRVFPRAKFYANHIHIIESNFIEIGIISSCNDNAFGFEIDTIDLRG